MNITVKPADLVEEYIGLRDAKKQAEDISKKYIEENFESRMREIESTLLDHLNQLGLDSIAGQRGTAYKQINTSVTAADMREFRRHVIGEEAWELADWRPNKTAINALAEQGSPLPPGINRTAFYTVQIRRK